MEPLEADDPLRVGRFEILARLGAGGMGRVYLARLPSGEQFALKMIHQFLSDDVQFRRRFQREVMAAQRVTGENTAALVDADPDARPPWMAVEYVDGPTLSELIERGGPLKLASSVRLASGMAQALISIHAAGLVHRDLKPSNVLMGAGGARLIDFGIAQASGASSLTMTGLVTGSAGFMSPEQAQAEHVTEASDVFALGTVLYFAATGRRPFGEGSMISVTYRVVHADPDLSLIRDEGLRVLIADCLMKDPASRPTPREIADRCPGIADGTWQADRSGHTMSTLAVGAAAESTRLHTGLPLPPQEYAHQEFTAPGVQQGFPQQGYPQQGFSQPGYGHEEVGQEYATNSGHPFDQGPPRAPMPIPPRRDSRRRGGWQETLRHYATMPLVAVPVGAAAVLAVGGLIALNLAPDPGSGTTKDATITSETEGPAEAVGPTASAGQLPTVPGATRPGSVPTATRPGTVLRPSSGPTVKPSSGASATKGPVIVPTEPDGEDPTAEEPEPDPDPTTASPTPSPTASPTASPTPSPTPSPLSTGAGGGAGQS
jgi:tRNA A-37 threonylcarbamoyl transferase component Bud32